MEHELTGMVAIVTGAGRMRSIGRPIANILAHAGATVVRQAPVMLSRSAWTTLG